MRHVPRWETEAEVWTGMEQEVVDGMDQHC